jgi:4'-phosphopantetheinyl transferase
MMERALGLVTPARRAKALRHRKEADRLRSLAAGLLMRRYLGVTSDGDLAVGPQGRPELARGGPSFSVSHSGDFTGMAVTDSGPCGLDIEPLLREVRRGLVAGRVFSRLERGALEASGHDGGLFIRIWTRKESLVKAAGVGLLEDPESFSAVPLDAPSVAAFGSLWDVATFDVDRHAFSVAVPYEAGSPLECRLEEVSAEELLEPYGPEG